MLGFYWSRIWSAVEAMTRGAGVVYTVPLLVAAVLVFFNPEIADAVSNWNGVSRWWALVILAVLGLYAVAHGHYERTTERDRTMAALKEQLDSVKSGGRSLIGFDISGASNLVQGARFGGSSSEGEDSEPRREPLEATPEQLHALGQRAVETARRTSGIWRELQPDVRTPREEQRQALNAFKERADEWHELLFDLEAYGAIPDYRRYAVTVNMTGFEYDALEIAAIGRDLQRRPEDNSS